MSLGLIADYGGVSSDEEVDDTSTSHNTTKNLAAGVRKETAKPQAHGDDVLEDFVRKTNYGSDVPEKPPGKPPVSELAKHMRLPSAKGKIQISIPSLQDSDSDDEAPKIKKPKPSSGASGFLGSLPQPRASGGGGKEAGRAFIPYTLTKHKPTTTNKPKPKAKPVTKLAEAYSDSDEEMQTNNTVESGAGNFFSLDSEPIKPAPMSMGLVNPTPSLSSDSNNYAQAGVASQYSGLETEPTQPRLTAASLYNMSEDVDYSAYQAPDTEQWSAEPSSSTDEVHNMLQSEEFMRLQGKKQRGKEHINLIDVHTDDQKISEIELTKNLSEEVDPAMFAHRKKGEGPSGQQKRKHQITYLAFQAKERELELKNTWAANKATKMQTQAKYGF